MIILQEVVDDHSPNLELYQTLFAYPYVNGTFGVFKEDGQEIGAVDYDLDISKRGLYVFIHYIKSINTDKGNARKMIEHLFSIFDIQTITGESTKAAEGFWKHIGAVFEEEVEEELEGYSNSLDCKPFILRKAHYEKLNNKALV